MVHATGQTPTASTALPDLSRLVLTEEIRRLKARYLYLLDTQQWDDLASLFSPDARFTLAAFGDPIVFESTAEWISYVQAVLGGGKTVHQVHQGEIDIIDENTASARWAMSDYVVPAARSGRESFYGHGHYIEQYRSVDGAWRIVELTLTRLMLNSPGTFG
jgi:3-phenylpropionate/cinnamic acid dioxygenase small subunit